MERWLIWDFDGTLAYRDQGWSGAVLEVLRREVPGCGATCEEVSAFLQSGFPWHTPERGHPELGTADAWWAVLVPVFEQAICGVLRDGMTRERARKLAERVRAVYLEAKAFRVYSDTVPALEALADCGWRHALFSNNVPELEALLEQLDLRRHFAHVFNSAMIGFEKPHAEAFAYVLASLGCQSKAATEKREGVWMIGDSITADVAGATAAGIPSILVRRHHAAAKHYCETLTEIAGVVGNRISMTDNIII